MQDKIDILKKLDIENFIWIIYIILILLSIYSNKYEKEYYLNNDIKAKENYRKLNIFIFSTALIIYLYFFEDSIKNIKTQNNNSKDTFNELNFIANSLILISGCIYLYIAIFDVDLDTELVLT